MPETLRYVPQGPVSLSSDAPGWSAEDKDKEAKGPTCWKCKGACFLPLKKKQKLSQKATDNQRTCPVCKGEGHLPIKSKYLQSQTESGVITSRRRRPRGWKEFGHIPPAVQAIILASNGEANNNNEKNSDGSMNATMQHALSLLSQANGRDDDYESKRKDIPITLPSPDKNQCQQHLPLWLPSNPGEQLCNLVGRWRILQRVASHRWTTDDLVTAHVAASTFVSSKKSNDANAITNKEEKTTIRYLDLGTGNASVLQMATWYLVSSLQGKKYKLEATGVEARSEAVGLARRSLSFNLGSVEVGGKVYSGGLEGTDDDSMEHDVQIVQGDFRDLVSLSKTNNGTANTMAKGGKGSARTLEDVASKKYDLVTGTPPYFRVDFTSSKNGTKSGKTTNDTDNKDEVITAAVIQQGGMPTSMQSAPARCEFRGGIEAYCLAASAMLSQPHGRFVVCENWLNNDRVWTGAKEAGLTIESVLPVMGGVRKVNNLFAVYVMKIQSEGCDGKGDSGLEDESKVRPSLVVRNQKGKWTKEYAEVMEAMSIPMV